jgi:amino acid transporter
MTDTTGPGLKRALGLPLLVFYGLGVTIGAGIFALVGEILGIAGDFSPLAFLLAGLVAAATARAYALLARRYPKAAGSALYAREAFGPVAASVVGLGVAITAVVGSGVITLAFAGHVATLVPLPQPAIALALLAVLAAVAAYGVRESLVLAAVITVLEVGTLAVIAAVGAPALLDGETLSRLAALPADRASLDLTVAAATVAFFAFIGFEDIVNMAEEAKDPVRTIGPAIGITLAVSTALYVLIAAIATASPNRGAIASSDAPLATLFADLTGLPAEPITVIAAISMLNGVLVTIVMASRVLYGMANESLLPGWLAGVAPVRRTPVRATVLVTLLIALLVLVAPMLGLAQATGAITLAVFVMVNLSLFVIAGRSGWGGGRGQRWWGLLGALLAGGLLLYEAQRGLTGG